MHLAAFVVALVACAAIIAIGIRFLLAPRYATLAFGVAADNLRALTEIKGVRDVTSGAVLLVVWAAAGGKLSTALGIHGLTAGLLVAAGLVLVLALG